jgi:hypothetical protein
MEGQPAPASKDGNLLNNITVSLYPQKFNTQILPKYTHFFGHFKKRTRLKLGTQQAKIPDFS